MDEIIESWRANNRINVTLIDPISDEGMACTLSKRGGRNVVRQFAHIHNNRIWQLEGRAKALAKGALKFETYDEPDKKTLIGALEGSTDRVEQMFQQAAEGKKGIRTFKRGATVHLAYFIAHESHHRGNILLTLKQCGHAIDANLRLGIWDWDRI